MSVEITQQMVQFVYERINFHSHGQEGIAEGLAEVLALPEVRAAIYADVRREIEAKLKAAGVTGYSVEGLL